MLLLAFLKRFSKPSFKESEDGLSQKNRAVAGAV
jgi:hypothetical protein